MSPEDWRRLAEMVDACAEPMDGTWFVDAFRFARLLREEAERQERAERDPRTMTPEKWDQGHQHVRGKRIDGTVHCLECGEELTP